MSKPEPKGTQSLEEILASIRRSLSEEATMGLADVRPGGLAASAQPQPQYRAAPAARAEPRMPLVAPEPAPRSDGLTSRLAGALADPGQDARPDDDLAEFFAHVPKRAVPQPTPQAPRDAPRGTLNGALNGSHNGAGLNGGGHGDLPWLLGRADGAPAPASPVAAPARTDHSGRQQPPAEEITLSRPETLRPSLPPLFGADQEQPPTVHVPGADAVLDALASAAPMPAPEVAAAEAPPPSAPEPAAEAPAMEAPPPPATEPAAEAAPAAAVPEPAVEAAAAAQPAPARPNGAMEDLIAQLLEPVLMRWLDANLPHMIEKTVRAEVERALAAVRPGPGNG